jgi:hypothetical protein
MGFRRNLGKMYTCGPLLHERRLPNHRLRRYSVRLLPLPSIPRIN